MPVQGSWYAREVRRSALDHWLHGRTVNAMVHRGSMEHNECILCGACVDNGSKDAIRFSFSADR